MEEEPFITTKRVRSEYYPNTESHKYEADENEIWKTHQLERNIRDPLWWTASNRTELMRWLLTFITGVLCGLAALLVTVATVAISSNKYKIFTLLIDKEVEKSM